MAAVPDIGFGSAQVGADLMALPGERGDVGGFRATVITGEDDERIVCLAVLLKRSRDFANDVVGLHHKVAILTESAFALPFCCRDDRCVW